MKLLPFFLAVKIELLGSIGIGIPSSKLANYIRGGGKAGIEINSNSTKSFQYGIQGEISSFIIGGSENSSLKQITFVPQITLTPNILNGVICGNLGILFSRTSLENPLQYERSLLLGAKSGLRVRIFEKPIKTYINLSYEYFPGKLSNFSFTYIEIKIGVIK